MNALSSAYLAKFHLPISNLSYQKGTYYTGISVFNSLPSQINELCYNRNKFKRSLKNFLYFHSFYALDEYFSSNKILNNWIKIDQLDVTCFIISLFTAKHFSIVSTSIFRSFRIIVDLFHVLYCPGSMCVGVTV
jgi:hypothetical protein